MAVEGSLCRHNGWSWGCAKLCGGMAGAPWKTCSTMPIGAWRATRRGPGKSAMRPGPTRWTRLFGRSVLRRNYYTDGQGGGRAPLDEALGIVEGCTPALARLMCRAGAVEHYEAAAESLKEYTRLDRQWPAYSAHGPSPGAADGPMATAQPAIEPAPAGPSVLRRGGRHRHSRAPGGNGGAQRQARRSIRQNARGEVGLCLHPDPGR